MKNSITKKDAKKYFWFNLIWGIIFTVIQYGIINLCIVGLVSIFGKEPVSIVESASIGNEIIGIIIGLLLLLLSLALILILIMGPAFLYVFITKKLKIDFKQSSKKIFKPLLLYVILFIIALILFVIGENTNASNTFKNNTSAFFSVMYVLTGTAVFNSIVTKIYITKRKKK